ncbi:SEC-C metal-binding domain-containing protein [Clostridium sp. FP1]|nr:SEC-C domain-containing protein [Clostridium sp. FP1]
MRYNNIRPISLTKVGRNDPCSCESGKKYKKYCGK